MPQRHSLYNNMKKEKQKNYYKMNKKQILMNTLKEKNFREFLLQYNHLKNDCVNYFSKPHISQ